MTARADISNHRRKVLEEREERRKALPFEERQMEDIRRGTAWEKGEAKPPFYREVLEEGVRRGDVVSKEECRHLETQLREAESQLRHYGAYPPRYKSQMEKDYGRLEGQLREAEERIEHARDFAWVTMKDRHHYSAEYALAQEFYSILSITEKEGDRGA